MQIDDWDNVKENFVLIYDLTVFPVKEYTWYLRNFDTFKIIIHVEMDNLTG